MADKTATLAQATVEGQVSALTALLDEAGADLDLHGPVPPSELKAHLEALEAEWAGQEPRRAADGQEPPKR